MPLNSDQLEAFEAVARSGNFTVAAAKLHLTQPALSRRIHSLEQELKTSLFLRKPTGAELTSEGGRLLRFVESKGLLETELRSDLSHSKTAEPHGLVRIAGYTSILHIVVTPSIGSYLRKHEQVAIQYQATQDIRPPERQAELLLKADTDLLLSLADFANRDLVSHFLGNQELIAVESSTHRCRQDVYLDTRPEDQTTVQFLKRQSIRPNKYERSYLYDEDGILKGVMEGLGRAVVFRSLIKKGMPLQKVRGLKPFSWPLYLIHRRQSYYPPAIEGLRNAIIESAAKYLR